MLEFDHKAHTNLKTNAVKKFPQPVLIEHQPPHATIFFTHHPSP